MYQSSWVEMGPLAASSILSSIECLHSDRELRVYDTLRKSKIASTSACSCCYHFLNVLVGVQFHWIFFFFFFLIVFVPMIENGSWSMTFEEVSFFLSMCVCNISVCLWKMQYPPPKSYLPHFPSCASPVQEGREWMRKAGVCFLFSGCSLCELEHVSDSAMWVLRVRDAVSPAVFAERQRKWFACFVYRLWALSTSARADVRHVTLSGFTEVNGA